MDFLYTADCVTWIKYNYLNLQDEAGSAENSSYKKLFSSHPDLKKRIEKLNKKK